VVYAEYFYCRPDACVSYAFSSYAPPCAAVHAAAAAAAAVDDDGTSSDNCATWWRNSKTDHLSFAVRRSPASLPSCRADHSVQRCTQFTRPLDCCCIIVIDDVVVVVSEV